MIQLNGRAIFQKKRADKGRRGNRQREPRRDSGDWMLTDSPRKLLQRMSWWNGAGSGLTLAGPDWFRHDEAVIRLPNRVFENRTGRGRRLERDFALSLSCSVIAAIRAAYSFQLP